jgi:hypothetical protein
MKAKKAKKITKNTNKGNVKAIVAFMIVALAFGILVLFSNYQENIVLSGMFQSFMVLVVIGMGMLLGLLYLVNKE